MRDIKILVISDDPKLNSAIANVIEAHCFQWKPGVIVFDPHGDNKMPYMNVDDTTVKQLAGECNVEISTMCVNGPRSIHYIPTGDTSIETVLNQLKEGIAIIQPTEPETNGDHHH